MSWHNKVIWSEGLFLRPQHFQQQDRYFEQLLELRTGRLRSYPWGFTEIKLDQDQLAIGKISISSARGVFPDGTPFDIPERDHAPPPIDLVEAHRGNKVYLALPVRQLGRAEFDTGATTGEGLARYNALEYDARDATAMTDTRALLQVGGLRLRLLTDSDERADYTCLAVAQIIETRADRRVLLDDEHLPPVLDISACSRLAGFASELQGMLHHRGEQLAARVAGPGKGGAVEVAQYLLLQSVNRYEPLMAHFASGHAIHPEDFYRSLLEAAGELSTYRAGSRRPETFPIYRHDDLKGTFGPVMASLHKSLGEILQPNVFEIELKEHKHGIRVGRVPDLSLLDTAQFVLAVTAQMPGEQVRVLIPRQMKVGTVENIVDLVRQQLPGIPVRPLAVAPPQIPFHAGNVYFELDRTNDIWGTLKQSAGFAIHVSGAVPGLRFQFWAIRG